MMGWAFEAAFDALWLTAVVAVFGIALIVIAFVFAVFAVLFPEPVGEILGGFVVMFLLFFVFIAADEVL